MADPKPLPSPQYISVEVLGPRAILNIKVDTKISDLIQHAHSDPARDILRLWPKGEPPVDEHAIMCNLSVLQDMTLEKAGFVSEENGEAVRLVLALETRKTS